MPNGKWSNSLIVVCKIYRSWHLDFLHMILDENITKKRTLALSTDHSVKLHKSVSNKQCRMVACEMSSMS